MDSMRSRVAMFLRLGSRDTSNGQPEPSRDAKRNAQSLSDRPTSLRPAAPVRERTYNDRDVRPALPYILALGVWLGGMAVAGLVVGAHHLRRAPGLEPRGRPRAGRTGRSASILARLHLVLYAAGGVMLLTLTMRRVLGPRPVGLRHSRLHHRRNAGADAGLRLRHQPARRGDAARDRRTRSRACPESDPRRASFYQLHGLSNLL